MFIELNEFKSKYNITDTSNEKLMDMAIIKEFPEFEEFHIRWSIEGNFLNVEVYDKDEYKKEQELLENEESSKNIILGLFKQVINMTDNFPFKLKSLMTEKGITEDEFLTLSVEKLKLMFGSYSNALEKIHDKDFMKKITEQYNQMDFFQ